MVPGASVPARWLTDNIDLLPARGAAADLACGTGRHARWLAARGLSVTAIDRDRGALTALRRAAEAERLPIAVVERDLEAGAVSLGDEEFDVIVGVHYLHRPLFPAILRAVRPGGVVVYETFTRAQATIGKPANPAFLLEPGELPALVHPLSILASREGLFDGRFVASIVAGKPSAITAAK